MSAPRDAQQTKMRVRHSSLTDSGRFILSLEVSDERLWEDIKRGQVTGLSIGSSCAVVVRAPWWKRSARWIKRRFNHFLDRYL